MSVLLKLIETVEAYQAFRTGNPYHDEEGRFTTGGHAQHGKHWAKRQRRHRRLKRLHHKIRQRLSAHKEDRRETKYIIQDHRSDYRGAMATVRQEKQSIREDKWMLKHEKEWLKENPREHEAIHARISESEEMVKEYSQKAQVAKAKWDDWAAYENVLKRRIDRLEQHKLRIEPALKSAESEMASGEGSRAWHAKGDGLNGNLGEIRSFSPSRTSKASSAEAILRHCLRQRGYTAAYRRGELTQRERLQLLKDIREYGRAWFRHEAEELFSHHGQAIERALGGAIRHHVSRFFDRARQFVRELILAGSLALSGGESLDAEDLSLVDRQARDQAGYFDAFEREVNAAPPAELVPDLGLNETTIVSPPAMTGAQFIAYAEMYGNAAWGPAQEVIRTKVIRGRVYVEERRRHGMLKDDMCSICRAAVAMGWQPIGTLPAIGDSECISSCHCYFQYRDAEGHVLHGTRKMAGRKKQLQRRPVVMEG